MQKEVLLTVRRLFEMYSSGEYSLEQLAIWSNAAGLRLRANERPLLPPAICRILKSPGYCTLTCHGINGPIVSRELWRATQAVFDERKGCTKK
jgi:hypothetical protein